jgi:diguanylate cyclase (GGDEF)-like protein
MPDLVDMLYGGVEDLAGLTHGQLVDRLIQLQSEVRGLKEQLQAQRVTDALTGLGNREFFLASLVQLCQRAGRFSKLVCMAVVDVDHFSQINEQYGSQCGDVVLTGIAGALRAAVRNYDLLARFGEDEFAVAIDNGDPRLVRQLGQRIQRAIGASAFCFDERVIPATVTIGLVVADPNLLSDKPELLVRSAIEATALARREGDGNLHVIELAAAPEVA